MEKNEEFSKELETQYSILIKAEAKKTEQRFIVMLVIMCISLISVIISLFFSAKAYINTKDEITKNVEESKNYYETLSITYNNGNILDLQGIGNDYSLSDPKTIQITNEGNNKITFSLKLSSIKSSLLATNNLKYSIEKDNQQITSKELPLSDGEILSNVTIDPEETFTYTIKVNFTGSIDDYSNYYKANVDVVQKKSDTNLLE